ncbi:CPBP family intramembrane glutamic endopeptidase [Arachidicoccus terrestris]|uniref:CPBP family intramembrane glutamic endopeptidase n=1 Tax=Arachidicoccus terrestris TaxID=2875539 RepID=UPI001CC4455C|nr:CPBP family intramembrane glutamic endopeptidase [Arachidicoccus terrestris]UAY53773.1 CPBP family intramembrane metalloprotease [Arachidicoccus terrestris]
MDQFPPLKLQVSARRQFFILLGMVCFGLLFSGIISFIMISSTPGATIEGITGGDPAFAELARWMQIISTFCIFAGPAFLFNLFVRPHPDYFMIKNRRPWRLWLLVIFIAVATISATDLVSWLQDQIPLSTDLKAHFDQVETRYDQQMLYMLELDSWGGFIKSLILIALLPALFEELLFRGCLQQIMLRWIKKPFWAILITSVIFSAIHGSYIGFLPRLFIGMILGYVFYYGRNIALNMVIHFINNGVIVAVLFYHNLKSGSLKEAMHGQSSLSLEIISMMALIILFYYFRKLALQINGTDTPGALLSTTHPQNRYDD